MPRQTGQSTVGPGMGYYVRLACAVLADHRLNFWMGPEAYQGRVLLDKSRACGLGPKEAFEMHRGHAEIADDHVETRRIDFPQWEGAFCHGGRQAALGVGMAAPQVDPCLNPAVVSCRLVRLGQLGHLVELLLGFVEAVIPHQHGGLAPLRADVCLPESSKSLLV